MGHMSKVWRTLFLQRPFVPCGPCCLRIPLQVYPSDTFGPSAFCCVNVLDLFNKVVFDLLLDKGACYIWLCVGTGPIVVTECHGVKAPEGIPSLRRSAMWVPGSSERTSNL